MLREDPLPEAGIPSAISLLGWDDVARDAILALRRAGPAAIEPLVSALLDPREDFAVRRRVPLVLATYEDPRALEGLAHGLEDRRFEVRYRCGRGLSRLTERDPSLRIAPSVACAAVLREVEAGAGVWEGRRLLDRFDDEAWSPVVDDVIRDRAHRSLEHVFTLLALFLPRQPLQIAFRGLHVNDPHLRGTALE
jgi:HEAT repeat protein